MTFWLKSWLKFHCRQASSKIRQDRALMFGTSDTFYGVDVPLWG